MFIWKKVLNIIIYIKFYAQKQGLYIGNKFPILRISFFRTGATYVKNVFLSALARHILRFTVFKELIHGILSYFNCIQNRSFSCDVITF